MKIQKLSKAQIQESLAQLPAESILGNQRNLTHKQKQFARGLVEGLNQTEAFDKAYQHKGKRKTMSDNASRLAKDSRIQAEVEALERAKAYVDYQTSSEMIRRLRSLVVSQLTKEATDPNSKAGERIQALSKLGQVAELSVYKSVSEQIVHKSSDKLRADLMAQIEEAMQANTIDVSDDLEAIELMAEISGLPRPAPFEDGTGATPPTPDPHLAAIDGTPLMHTIPDTQSPKKTNLAKNHSMESTSYTHVETLPHRNDSEEGGGGTKNHPDWQEVPTGNTPPSVSKQNG
jgi:phage terminase small subunit